MRTPTPSMGPMPGTGSPEASADALALCRLAMSIQWLAGARLVAAHWAPPAGTCRTTGSRQALRAPGSQGACARRDAAPGPDRQRRRLRPQRRASTPAWSRRTSTGIVTSASLMVRRPGGGRGGRLRRGEARARRRAAPGPGRVGLLRDGSWERSTSVVPPEDAAAVEREVSEQLRRFRDLVGRDPTHLDSHQHVHLDGAGRGAVAGRLAAKLGVPLRARTRG